MVTLGDFPAGTRMYHVRHEQVYTDGPESQDVLSKLGLFLGVLPRRDIGWSKLVVRLGFLEKGSEK